MEKAIYMTTDSIGAASCQEAYDPAVSPDTNSRTRLNAERLAALRCELDAGGNQWGEQITATVEEDYLQLMRDLGLR